MTEHYKHDILEPLKASYRDNVCLKYVS